MPDSNRLTLTSEEMRELGYSVVDLLVEHFAGLSGQAASRTADPAELRARLTESVPEQGSPPGAVIAQLRRDVFSYMAHLDHPRFFAFVPSPSNFIGVMADTLAAGFNVFAGSWAVASGPAQVELVTLDWLVRMCQLPASAGGLFTSGGSAANLTALAVARHVRLGDGVAGASVYCSDQTHSSIHRALRLLGFTDHQVRRLPADEQFRLDLAALRIKVEDDRRAGLLPFCVIANAGTTNTGAVDPLGLLVKYCQEEGLWLHADGAYGAPTLLCEPGQHLLRGIGGVDSVSLDPHKWLFQPIEIGCVLMRERRHLRETFQVLPEYLKDVKGEEGETNFRDYGIQLTRAFRALKLWRTFKVFGRQGLRAAVLHGIELAEFAERCLRRELGWEIITPAQLGIVTFRFAPGSLAPERLNLLNARIVAGMNKDGFAMLSSTELRGNTVIRMCTINPRTSDADIRDTVHGLVRIGERLLSDLNILS